MKASQAFASMLTCYAHFFVRSLLPHRLKSSLPYYKEIVNAFMPNTVEKGAIFYIAALVGGDAYIAPRGSEKIFLLYAIKWPSKALYK